MTDTSKATIAAVVKRLNARQVNRWDGKAQDNYWAPDEQCREAASLISALEAERDDARKLANRYAWERDKAREERDVAEYRSAAFWKPLNAKTVARAEAAEALNATLQKAAEERDEWLRFIARWAWDKTGPADERLSVIQYFPPVKAARPEHLSTLRETTDDQT